MPCIFGSGVRDGTVWLGTYGGFNRWDKGKITIPRTGSAKLDGRLDGRGANVSVSR